MQTIFVSPEFPLNRRMRKAVRRGKLRVVREGGERLSLGGEMSRLRTETCITSGAQNGGGGAAEKNIFLLPYNPDSKYSKNWAREKANRFRKEMDAARKGERVVDWNCARAWEGEPMNVGEGLAVARYNCPQGVGRESRGLLLWQGNPDANGIFGLVEAATGAQQVGGVWYALWKLDLQHFVHPEDEEGGPIIPIGELRKKLGWHPRYNPRTPFQIRRAAVADALVSDMLFSTRRVLRVMVPDISDDGRLVEGGVRRVTVNAYERNPKAREECIAEHGARCCVCGFDFGRVYGEAIGKGFIHVHHLTLISQIGREYRINPKTDLRPVCPNCHAMLHHRRGPPLKPDELREKIRWQYYPRNKPEKSDGK